MHSNLAPFNPPNLTSGAIAHRSQMSGSSQAMMQMMVMFMGLMTQLMSLLFGQQRGLVPALSSFGGARLGTPGIGGSPLNGFLGGGNSAGAPLQGGAPGSNSSPVGNVNPSTVKDKTGTHGISAAARSGLNEAHRFGLPLVSGKRNGGGKSDHDHGNAIDVGTLAIGSPSSTGGTSQMKAYAEKMRQMGKAGRGNVKYVIADGKIASARNNWAWRPYTYPGKSQGDLARLKRTNRGEYNRLQHYDHVHVSFT